MIIMVCCCACECTSRHTRSPSAIINFYRFPVDEKTKRKWFKPMQKVTCFNQEQFITIKSPDIDRLALFLSCQLSQLSVCFFRNELLYLRGIWRIYYILSYYRSSSSKTSCHVTNDVLTYDHVFGCKRWRNKERDSLQLCRGKFYQHVQWYSPTMNGD